MSPVLLAVAVNAKIARKLVRDDKRPNVAGAPHFAPRMNPRHGHADTAPVGQLANEREAITNRADIRDVDIVSGHSQRT
jgi:hypothetical protein